MKDLEGAQGGPARATSLPAERAHPSATNISEALDHLRSLSANPACTSNRVYAELAGLSALCSAVDELLRLSASQRAVARISGGAPFMEDALEGYVQLLDACTAARDALLLTKGQATAVDSALRRRGTETTAVLCYVEEYVRCRRKARKSVVGSLKQLNRKARSQHRRQHGADDDDPQVLALAGTLREVWAAAASVLSLLLRFVTPAPTPSNGSSWGLLVPHVFAKGRSAAPNTQQREEEPVSDVELADAAVAQLRSQLRSGKGGGTAKTDVVRTAQMRLKALAAHVDRLEPAVDGVYMGLIRNRVTLLNIINP